MSDKRHICPSKLGKFHAVQPRGKVLRLNSFLAFTHTAFTFYEETLVPKNMNTIFYTI